MVTSFSAGTLGTAKVHEGIAVETEIAHIVLGISDLL